MIFPPAVRVSVELSDTIPVSETDVEINWKIPPNMYVALKLFRITKLRVALFGAKHVVLQIQLLSSTLALFVRTELLCSFIRRLPPIRANGVVYSNVALFSTTMSNKYCGTPDAKSVTQNFSVRSNEKEKL